MLSFLLAILIFSTLLGIPAFARSEHDDPDVLRRLNDLLKEKDRLGKDYKDVVLITEPIEYEDEPETQQKEQQNAEEEVQEKHVLYAGARERNN